MVRGNPFYTISSEKVALIICTAQKNTYVLHKLETIPKGQGRQLKSS